MTDIEQVRVTHKVLNYKEPYYQQVLNEACYDAEQQGLILVSVVPTMGDMEVAVFVGAESYLFDPNCEEAVEDG